MDWFAQPFFSPCTELQCSQQKICLKIDDFVFLPFCPNVDPFCSPYKVHFWYCFVCTTIFSQFMELTALQMESSVSSTAGDRGSPPSRKMACPTLTLCLHQISEKCPSCPPHPASLTLSPHQIWLLILSPKSASGGFSSPYQNTPTRDPRNWRQNCRFCILTFILPHFSLFQLSQLL